MRSVSPLTAANVKSMLDQGVDHSEVLAQLVGTGIWSDDGAKEIIRFLTEGPDEFLARNRSLDGSNGQHATMR